MKNLKRYIPNFLTSLRILFTPIVIYLGITNHYFLLIGIAIVIAFTDFVDGFLARKWNVTSELGAKLDMFADKMLAIGLLIVLIVRNHAFFYVLVLEVIIALMNLYFYFKKGIAASLLVGKLKTWVIFITIILGFVELVYPEFHVDFFVYLTLAWQIVTLICYFLYRNRSIDVKKKTVEEEYFDFYELVGPILKKKDMQLRKNYPHHIHESVYDHVLRVSFDCYKIGKRWGMDYQSLAIAGILHDFYEKPWQYDLEVKPFFQKHAFTHAKNAIVNAKKIYGTKVVTPKVEQIMETHMFPLNKKFPRSKEAWLLTIVDKADSMDFLLHPILLYKIFFDKEYRQKKKDYQQKRKDEKGVK